MYTTCVRSFLDVQAAEATKKASGSAPDVKSLAKKTPFGLINVGDLAFDLPGSGVSKDDLPNNVKPGDAQGLPKGPTAKPPSGPSLPKVKLLTVRQHLVLLVEQHSMHC